jgi:hypothetical protein
MTAAIAGTAITGMKTVRTTLSGLWSKELKNNIGYRIVRSEELTDPEALCAESTPLILMAGRFRR